jgi:hypothetical protein
VLERRRAILEQQREDIEAVLGEIAAFEKQCRDFLAVKGKKPERGGGGKSAVNAKP